MIALYLERDAESKSKAAAYVEAERQLRRIATANRDEINNRRWPSLMHKLGRAVNAVEPKIPVDWLHQFIHACGPDTPPQFQRHLPEKVQTAAERFRRACQTLCGS